MSRLARSTAAPFRDWRTHLFQAGVFALLLLLVSMVGAARAATNVSGTISSNQTWTLAGSPYVMTGNVTVNSGVTLTIEAGVTVQGNAATRALTVNGSLSAVGTSGQPITFTSTLDSAPGLSRAGRSLSKHQYRGGPYPRATGSPAAISRQAQDIVDDVLTNPASTFTTRQTGRFGEVVDIQIPGGAGVRYSESRGFLHFLEPPR